MANEKTPSWQDKIDEIKGIVSDFLEQHPKFIDHAINKDAALKGKPYEEVKSELSLYPGVIAVAVNKVAHKSYKEGKGLEARALSETAHTLSGIDIHPGTQIGDNCFIDHGTGVVIGETAKIGKNTLIYHEVTLGAYINPEEKNPEILKHRHPEIGDNCLISVGAKILGNVKIGNNVTIGPAAQINGKGITVGNSVKIGAGASIGGGNQIADGVEIGDNAEIPRNTGKITQDVANAFAKTKNGKANGSGKNEEVPATLLSKPHTIEGGRNAPASYYEI